MAFPEILKVKMHLSDAAVHKAVCDGGNRKDGPRVIGDG
jgi:hypothetical protein